MATWKDLSTSIFKIDYKDAANTYPSQAKMRIILQYDESSITPTKAKVRFKYWQPGSAITYGNDGMYILYDANNTSDLRSLYKIKSYTNGTDNEVVYYTDYITLTKSYNSETFFLQDVWICNTGSGTVDINDMTVTYKAGTKTVYNWFKEDGNRAGYAYRQSAGQSLGITTNDTVATSVTAYDPEITNHGNNTFSIVASAGKAGENNKVNNTYLYYRIGDSGTYTKAESLTISKKSITASSNAKSQKVYAYTVADGQYNDDTSKTVSLEIPNYKAPKTPGIPYLVSSSFKNNRLTVKQDWGWQWDLSSQANENSPIKGYRIRFFINNKNTKIIDYYDKKTVRSYELSKGDWVYDRSSTSYPMPMSATDPEEPVKPGDLIKLSVQAYSVNGTNTKLFSTAAESDSYTVQNAGVIHVKVGSAWKEGQVYVKAGGTWHEAETVNIKVNGKWEESQ